MSFQTVRWRGAVLLARTGLSQEDVAVRVRKTRQAVSKWLRGESRPDEETRKLLVPLGVPEASWDVEATAGDFDVPSPRVVAPVATGGATVAPDVAAPVADSDPLSTAAALHAEAVSLVRTLHEAVECPHCGEKGLPLAPTERAKIMSSVVSTLGHAAKLTGQFDLGSRILRLPVWRRIESAMADALRPHPEAAGDVARALRALEDELTS